MNQRPLVLAVIMAAALFADAAQSGPGDEGAWQMAVQKFAVTKQKRDKEPRAFSNAILGLGDSTYDKRDHDTVALVVGVLLEEFRHDTPDGRNEDEIDGLVIEACEITLRKVTSKKAVSYLISMARNARLNPRIRFSVCRSLGYQSGEHKPEVTKVLVEMLDENDPRLLLGAVDGLREQLKSDLSERVEDLLQAAGTAATKAAKLLEAAGQGLEEQPAALLKKRCETVAALLEDAVVGFTNREAVENCMLEIRAIGNGIKDDETKKKVAPRVDELDDVVGKFLRSTDELAVVREAVEPTMLALLNKAADTKQPWEVRISALHAVTSDRHVSHVDPLLETLKGHTAGDGRLRVEVMAALGAILGVKDPRSDDPNWWKSALAERRSGKRPSEGGGTGAVPTDFFGLKTKSTRIVFILDRTLSMELPCTVEIPKKDDPPPQSHGTPSGDEKRDEKAPPTPDDGLKRRAGGIKKKWDERKIEKRIDALKREFIGTIYNLDPQVYFAVVTFAGNSTNWKPMLVQATWANKLDCILKIDRLSLDYATNIWDGLESALRYVAEPQKPEVIKFDKKGNYATMVNGADTFFLMTDGNHNTGKFTRGIDFDDRAFFAEFKKIHAIRRTVVNTIILGDTGDDNPDPIQQKSLKLFKKMAEVSGGAFVHLGK
ncbi:MAG: VWA domain-containing protein [Planctomycetes bacterium]|nr:VWA domain-containing protein [Planctomycetota bacterium]